MSADPLHKAADQLAVSQLVLCERESRDLGLWNRMQNCYWPDSIIDLSWFKGSGPEFVKASEDMAARGMKASHRLSPVLVHVHEDRAVASLPGIIDIPLTIGTCEMMLSAYCLMVYRVERRAGSWKLSSFTGIYRHDELTAVLPGVYPEINPQELSPFRSSYRFLSYSLQLTGYQPRNDLPGFDRPETVTAIMDEVFGWAGLPAPD